MNRSEREELTALFQNDTADNDDFEGFANDNMGAETRNGDQTPGEISLPVLHISDVLEAGTISDPIVSFAPPCANIVAVEKEATLNGDSTGKVWADISYNELFIKVESMHKEITTYRRNIFKVPSGKAGKDFISELSFWLKQFNSSSKLNRVAIQMFICLPLLLLQKPGPRSKAKDHSLALARRLELFKSGAIDELLKEIRFIQKSFTSSRKAKTREQVSRIFAKLMFEGKVSAALKILEIESGNGVLDVDGDILEELKLKHPDAEPVSDKSLLHGPLLKLEPWYFDAIDEQTVLKAVLHTKGSAGPSGLDSDAFRRILTSKNFSAEGKMLREQIAVFARNMASISYAPQLLGSYTASRIYVFRQNAGHLLGILLRGKIWRNLKHAGVS